MLSHSDTFIGIDLGSSGLRITAIEPTGSAAAGVSRTWPANKTEQDPRLWAETLHALWAELRSQLSGTVRALSVCSTSGTVLAVDRRGEALGPAWMYSDRRGAVLAREHGVPPSWGLSHWLWWCTQYPRASDLLAHPTDYLLGKLGGVVGLTDHTSALKSGFDPATGRWSRAEAVGIDVNRLPQVVRPGTVVGKLSPSWGMGSDVLLVAGCTDGVAGQIASGALRDGQVCVSLGSTLIFKGVSPSRLDTVDGSVYSHLHPDGEHWLPGAASTCGGAILGHFFEADCWDTLAHAAESLVPTGAAAYPLALPGERFPLVAPDFPGSLPNFDRQDPRFYAGLLEGVAFVERLGLERLTRLGMPLTGDVLTVGGGTRSDLWLKIRASVLGRDLLLPEAEPAFGAAILAAAGYWQITVAKAAEQLVRVERRVEPVPEWVRAYEEIYRRFKKSLGTPLQYFGLDE